MSQDSQEVVDQMVVSEDIGEILNVEDLLGISDAIVDDIDGEDDEGDWKKADWEEPKSRATD